MTSDALHRLLACGEAQAEFLHLVSIGYGSEVVLHVTAHQCAEYADTVRRLTEALWATLPSETEGRCTCGYCEHNGTEWRIGGVPQVGDEFCPRCGDHCCPDGIALRNADAGRVERVRAELDAIDAQATAAQFPPLEHGAAAHASIGRVDDVQEYGERSAAESVRRACKRIRAALDGNAETTGGEQDE